LKDHPAVFHTDAVQAYGLETIHPHELGVDMLSVSGHKFNGPKGVGFLYKNDNIHLPRFMRGGEQEEKRRAGTENLAGIVGMAKAISLLPENVREEKKAQYRKFQKIVTDTLDAAEVRYHVNGNLENNLTHVLNLWIEGVNSNLLLMSLDLKGVAISTGSACTAGNIEPSHVIQAMRGVDSPAVNETVRFSFGLNNTEEQVKYAADELVNVAKRFQK
jgi:cysteine desulfurase